jgi:hypothetical protein
MPKIIFANLVNHLMSTNPTDEYSLSLAAMSHREIWLAEKEDIVISGSECPPDYKCYVCELLGIETDSILTLCPKGKFSDLLTDRFWKDLSIQETVARHLFCRDHWGSF